jgi:hypothetical protein
MHSLGMGSACAAARDVEIDMRALMNLAIEPALHLFEVSALVVLTPSQQAVQRVLKVLADTPMGAVKIVRDRYPKSRAHQVLAQHDLPDNMSFA